MTWIIQIEKDRAVSYHNGLNSLIYFACLDIANESEELGEKMTAICNQNVTKLVLVTNFDKGNFHHALKH